MGNTGHNRDSSGSSDSSFEDEDETLTIRPKLKLFNNKKHLIKYLKKSKNKDSFEKIVCSGNSYDLSSCEYISELIQ